MAVELHLAHGSPPQSLQLVPVPDENEEEDPDILDLGGQNLEKLSRAAPEWQLNTTTLILDDNLLQRLDNIHTYQCLERLSVQNNQLIRMFQVAKLSHLKILNLANNHVVTMEGLKELKLLTWLSLAANNVKSIENLSQNVHLEHLDLSDNAITTITDVSYLKNIKSLLLHKNRIGGLLGCERYLPTGLTTLTLSDNLVEDLTDVSHLSTLQSLEQLTFANNPAIEQPEDIRKQFDYRPYIINWCLGIQVLDGILVGAKESLKAEWMYSQSKGRQFTNGYHSDLLDYLVETCPLHPDKDWQEDKKLNLILSKVQEHQSSLRNGEIPNPGSSTLPRSFNSALRGTPRRNSSTDASSSSVHATPRSMNSTPRSMNSTPTLQRRNFQSRSASSRPSRTSPSPVRRATPAQGAAESPRSYRVALPRTLYGDDVNGNPDSLMTQSMDPNQLSGTLRETSHLSVSEADGNGLMSQSINDERLFRSSGHRPNSLFSTGEAEIQLQDLSDNELGQTKLYNRLQNRLNPVPESLNSPDVPMPKRNNQRDDPMFYNRELTASYHSGSTQEPFQSLPMSASYHPGGHHANGCSSSSDPEGSGPPVPAAAKSKPKTRPTRLNRNNSSTGIGYQRANGNAQSRSASVGPSFSGTTPSARKTTPPNRQVVDLKKNDESARKRPQNSRQISIQSTAEEDSSHSESDNELLRQRNKSNNRKNTAHNETSKASRPNSARLPVSNVGGRTPTPKQLGSTLGVAEGGKSPRYSPDKYSSDRESSKRSKSSNRPGSAPIKTTPKPNASRQRANTVMNHVNQNGHRRSPGIQGSIMSKSNYERNTSGGNANPDPMTNSSASTVIQKNWRGHVTRNKDEKVKELKHEVRSLRTEEHVKFLTKELSQAKTALEQERKLRSLQMDAIKVLWKEVQMMDATKGGSDRAARPSGSYGSKISSRSSEHSIAKLMETLEATAGNGSNSQTLATPMKSTSSSEGGLKTPSMSAADSETIQKLNSTCNSLQNQVEQLQDSLNGVMKFMSAFSSNAEAAIQRTRHSSSTSTQDTTSFQYYHTPSAGAGPSSLPPSLFSSMVEQSATNMYTSWDPQNMPPEDGNQGTPTSAAVNNMSRSCDSLVQTDITAILTPKAEDQGQRAASSVFRLKTVDIPLDDPNPNANRPSTLPGLNDPKAKKSTKRSKIPGLKALAGQAVLASPKAPAQVKTYAKNLVDEVLSDTVSKAISDSLQMDDGTDISSSWAHDEDETKSPPTPTHEISHSSMVETDSLEENSSPKKTVRKARKNAKN